MKQRMKTGVLLALATAVGMIAVLSFGSTKTSATPGAFSTLTAMALSTSQSGTVTYSDESGAATLFLSGPAGAALTACSVTDAAANPGTVTFTSPSNICVIADDLDTLVETATISFTVACGATAGTISLFLSDLGGAISTSVTCGAASTLTVTANPTVLTCYTTGATSLITASGVAPGTVTFTADSGGVMTPSVATVVGGVATSTLTMTSVYGGYYGTGGTGVITVTATSSTGPVGFVTVSFNCGTYTPTIPVNPCTYGYNPYGTTGYPYGTTGYPYGTTGYPYGTTGYPYGTAGYPYGTTGYPYGTTGYGYGTTGCVPASISLTASPNPISSCTGSSTITATVYDTSGAVVPNGTTVNFSGSSGLGNTSASTSGGIATAVFTASNIVSYQTVTITATSGSATGSVSLAINCTPTTTTAQVAPPPPLPVARAIVPPSTGDAGLASDGID